MYDYPLEPDWSTEEIIEVVGLYNAVEQAYEEGISSKEFMEHYRAFTSIADSKALQKQLDKAFEEAIENETDPSAKIVHQMNQTINNRDISFFVKNSQVNSSTVNNFVKRAKSKKIPILQVRETIPNNTTYLKWITENYQNLANINKKLK